MMVNTPSLVIGGVFFQSSNPEAAKSFIDKHGFLTRTLCKSPGKIREIFDEDVNVILEPEFHPVDPDFVVKVWILIETDMDRDKAFKKLKVLDQHWWLDTEKRCRGYLGVDLL